MRLQPKKPNQPTLPPIIAGVFLFSLIYWTYLALTIRMDIAFDSIGYEALGRMINTHGWISYFTTGPNREPIYPFLIAASMRIADITGLAYVKIMALFGVLLMFLTQSISYKILRLLKVRNGICALMLAYLAMSPALNNSAFSLYSEIAALPVVLGIILATAAAWEAISQSQRRRAIIYSALLGILLTAATLIKAVFECIAPIYLLIFFRSVFLTEINETQTLSLRGEKRRSNLKIICCSFRDCFALWARNDTFPKITTLLLCSVAAFSFFYVPITGYKWLNKHYNGAFAVTNRGSWALYGNTARRMEPLNTQRLAEALAYVPGEGVCISIFGSKECEFWSFKRSDELGYAKLSELTSQHLSPEEINTSLIEDSARQAFHNPFQYSLLTFFEGIKMFFWESTQIGFVNYPHWLQKIYNIKIFNNGLRLFTSLISLIAVISLWFRSFVPRKLSPIGFLIGALIFLYILFFSFFFILTRYALPIAPLYLICIGIGLNENLAPKKTN